MSTPLDAIEANIRDIADFPKPGILFKDITPLLGNGPVFQDCITLLADQIRETGATKVVGLDARGFIFGAAVADRLGVGFVPVRKKGKLPYETNSVAYDLEYGSNTVEMHIDAVEKGEKVVIVDDLLATGGTAKAAVQLIQDAGADLVSIHFVIELAFLSGRDKLGETPIHTLLTY